MFVVVKNGTLSEEEKQAYIDYVKKENPDKNIKTLTISVVDDEYVDLEYEIETIPFERIRRICGYLVGDLRYWNNAKRAEEKDRVKHGAVR